jgi:DNA-binding MarR family transcriptional regulator
LTAEGRKLSEKLLRVSREREALLFKYFTPADKEHLNVLLRQLTLAFDDSC